MKLIDTSVVTNAAGYPGLANNASVEVGIDFLQASYKELTAYLAQSLFPVGSPVIEGTAAGLLQGGVVSGSTISAGAVYFNGEIFAFPSSTIAGSTNTYIIAGVILNPTDTGANKTLLTDGITQVSMHNQRTVVFQYSSSPTGTISGAAFMLPLYAIVAALPVLGWTTTNFVPVTYWSLMNLPLIIGSGFQILTDGSGNYLNFTTPNDGLTRTYSILTKVAVFDAPDGTEITLALNIGGTNIDLCPATVPGTGICNYIGSIAPNTLISVQAQLNSGTSGLAYGSLKIHSI